MSLSPEAAYRQFRELVATEPDVRYVHQGDAEQSAEAHRWLARLHALLEATGNAGEALALRMETKALGTMLENPDAIRAIAHRALAAAELAAPSEVQGSFIPAGQSFDAFSALSKLLRGASSDVLIVDPYMDAVTVTDFVPLIPEAVPIRLLSDAATVYGSLKPACERWAAQNGASRPLSARLASPKSLHDRLLIVDATEAWILTQSLKDFASRSHGAIQKVDAETAQLKVRAYEGIWNASGAL